MHPKTILEVGCGEGNLLAFLRKHNIGKDLTGIDYSKEIIAAGKIKYPFLNLIQQTLFKLPFKDNTFDLVIYNEGFEYLEHPDKALKEIARVSKKYCLISYRTQKKISLTNFFLNKKTKNMLNEVKPQRWSAKQFKNFISRELTIQKIKKLSPWIITAGVK